MILLLLSAFTFTAKAQWDREESHTTASLRGVTRADDGAVWASETGGTVLRSKDGGRQWETCTRPPGAEKLDFRGIQAWDERTAIVMSSGPGIQSRLYKTIDGCQTWKLLFTNPDAPGGFYDALLFLDRNLGLMFGDPTHCRMNNAVESGYFTFRIRVTHDGGETWTPVTDPEANSPGKNLMPRKDEGLFAASNSSAAVSGGWLWIGTGGGRVLRRRLYTDSSNKSQGFRPGGFFGQPDPLSGTCGIPWTDWTNTITPLASASQTSGIFSLVFRNSTAGVAVGGDYRKPDQSAGTAAYSLDGGTTWKPAQTPPHGYRSAVAYDDQQKLWVAVGPNGTDFSSDDGRTWQPLRSANGDPADTDKNWNALSLPFAVGPNGRIGRLRRITPEH